MPENRTSVLFGKNIDEKTQFKNLSKSNKGRAENSCKFPCNKSMKGKTLTNPDVLQSLFVSLTMNFIISFMFQIHLFSHT